MRRPDEIPLKSARPTVLVATRRTAIVLVTLAATRTARAAALACKPADTAFVCHLRSVLTILDGIAWILGVLLVAVLLVAIQAYRLRRKQLPDKEVVREAK